jgi:hypothetical protein
VQESEPTGPETTGPNPEQSADQPTSDPPATDTTSSSGPHPSGPDQSSQPQSPGRASEPSTGETPPRTAEPAPEQQSERNRPAPDSRFSSGFSGQPEADVTPSEHLSGAESRLAETVRRFSEQAALTDDPRRAREYLEAAREAAETLETVRF